MQLDETVVLRWTINSRNLGAKQEKWALMAFFMKNERRKVSYCVAGLNTPKPMNFTMNSFIKNKLRIKIYFVNLTIIIYLKKTKPHEEMLLRAYPLMSLDDRFFSKRNLENGIKRRN
jgi:hypothetical protein